MNGSTHTGALQRLGVIAAQKHQVFDRRIGLTAQGADPTSGLSRGQVSQGVDLQTQAIVAELAQPALDLVGRHTQVVNMKVTGSVRQLEREQVAQWIQTESPHRQSNRFRTCRQGRATVHAQRAAVRAVEKELGARRPAAIVAGSVAPRRCFEDACGRDHRPRDAKRRSAP